MRLPYCMQKAWPAALVRQGAGQQALCNTGLTSACSHSRWHAVLACLTCACCISVSICLLEL